MDERDFAKYAFLIIAVVAVVALVTADGGITGLPVANQPQGANGQACRARAPLCDAGLQCVNRVCRPEPPRGGLAQSCRARNPRCDAGLACVQGVCRVPQAVGGACRNSQECQGGLVCTTGRCTQPSLCLNGACVNRGANFLGMPAALETCLDTDGMLNGTSNLTPLQGTVSGINKLGQEYSLTDTCINDKFLLEYDCEGLRHWKYARLDNGTVVIYDGIRWLVNGSNAPYQVVSGTFNGIFHDFTPNLNRVLSHPRSQVYNCLDGCRNGECVSPFCNGQACVPLLNRSGEAPRREGNLTTRDPPALTTCIDTDSLANGTSNITPLQGMVSGVNELGREYSFTDSCVNDQLLVEYDCEGGPQKQLVRLNNGTVVLFDAIKWLVNSSEYVRNGDLLDGNASDLIHYRVLSGTFFPGFASDFSAKFVASRPHNMTFRCLDGCQNGECVSPFCNGQACVPLLNRSGEAPRREGNLTTRDPVAAIQCVDSDALVNRTGNVTGVAGITSGSDAVGTPFSFNDRCATNSLLSEWVCDSSTAFLPREQLFQCI